MDKTIYVKISQNVLVHDRNVKLEDIASILCNDKSIERQVKQLKLYAFPNQEKKKQYRVFSILKVVELIQQKYPNAQVSNEGELDFVVEYVVSADAGKYLTIVKTMLLTILIFFGSAFSIMAFNNDVSIGDLFAKFYYQITGQTSSGVTELEISYCIGLGIGITVFFNHIGKKKLTPDPTPLQVEMRKYETDVNTTYIENAGREGKEFEND